MLRRPYAKIVVAALLALVAVQGVQASTGYSQTIYRASAFSTQVNDYFCTAAVTQNIVNLVTGAARHDRTQQREYYNFGRAHNRYSYRADGVDPQGMEAMLEEYVPDSEWRQVRRKSLRAILRVAARQMRATGLPAVLFVGGGAHVWTMNGYTATRDPASGRWFTVTHVKFSGPFYPRQIAKHGWFDLKPNTGRRVERFANAFYPYREWRAFHDHRWTPWNGYYVVVVPWSIGDGEPEPTPEPTPVPTPQPTPQPTPDATVEPTPEPTVEPSLEPTLEPSLEPSLDPNSSGAPESSEGVGTG